jgi:Profilin
VGFDGTTWANSPEYTVLPEEAVKLSGLLAGSSLDSIAGSGFTVAGAKYAFTRGEVDDEDGGVPYLQGRCKDEGKSSQGVIVMRCNTCLVVGVHEPQYSNNRSFGQVNTDIGRLADYMMESGY